MAQGYSGFTLIDNKFSYKDSSNLDAFSRLRISNPFPLFSCQFTYDLAPLLFEKITTTNGAISHDTTNRCANLSLTSAVSGNKAIMQTFEHFPYQPGKSQLVFITFNMENGVTNCLKFAGISTGDNGIEFQVSGSTYQFVIYSDTSAGDETVTQPLWNLDKLDGTGPSGKTFNPQRTQILVIDFQALYVGRVRVGFDIGGLIIYCHEFLHANTTFTAPYLQTATLPIRVGMTASGSVTTTMKFICSSVISEGGTEDINLFSYAFAVNSGAVSASTTATHILSIRPKTTFNSITNRSRLTYVDLEVFNEHNQPIFWELCVGQTFTSVTPSDVNSTYSATEYFAGTNGTLGTSGTGLPIVIDSGYLPATNAGRGTPSNFYSLSRYPLTLNAAGATRPEGILTLKATTTIGTGNLRAVIKFRELR